MWKFPIIKNDCYNCFQFLVATVSKYYGCDHRLMMLELWGFSYDCSPDTTIGDKLKLCWNSKTERRKRLLRYHGISFEITSVININIDAFVSQRLLNYPIAVYVDSFVCSWVPFYQKIHRPHTFFILHKTGREYYILDQYCEEGTFQTVSTDFIKNNATSVITFCLKKTQEDEIKNHILESLEEWDISGFTQYKLFIEDMKKNLDIKKEVGEDPVASMLVMYLKNLSDDRQNFIEAICLMEEKLLVNMNLVKQQLLDISNRYLKIRAYIIKCAFLHKVPKEDIISKEMDCIYYSERKTYEMIKDICNVAI